MPYMIDDHNCVRKQNADGGAGPLLKCYDDRKSAEDYLKALYANVKDASLSPVAEFSMSITKASYDTYNANPRHWRAVDSDIDSDLYDEKMSLELFKDFTERINNNTPVPEEFKSVICESDWCGGMPYLSIAHYKAGEAARNVPGKVESIYIDGTRLKSKGTLDDTELGRRVFDALRDDAIKRKSGDQQHLPVRISIGFLDLQHKHTAQQGGQEFIFTRSNVGQICPLCEQGIGGKIYLKGQLVHLALTRVPVNPRTEMVAEKSMEIITKKDDAKSIIGDDLIDKLDERSLAEGTLVVRADGTTVGSMPTPDPMFKECYDPNTDSYNQDCLNRTLVANMVELRKTFQTVKSATDEVAGDKTKSIPSEKSGVSEATMTDTVEKMQLGGENVPEKPFSYSANGTTVTGDGGKVLADPIPTKAKDEEMGEEDDSKDDEKKEKSLLDAAYAQLKSKVEAGASVEEVNAMFAELGTAVEKSYQAKSQPVDASNLAEIVRSAVESAVAPLKMEIAQLKASNTVSKSAAQIPTPRSLTLKPNDLLLKAQSASAPVAPQRKLTQIEMIARKSTGASLPE